MLVPILAVQGDTDLPAAVFSLVFPSGSSETTLCSSIPITDDELLEGNHELTVTITGAGAHALIGNTTVTTVTITDDEGQSLASS